VGPYTGKKDVKAVVIGIHLSCIYNVLFIRPVKGQQQHFRTEMGNSMVPRAIGRAEEQTVD
jgi:hypothetical protein